MKLATHLLASLLGATLAHGQLEFDDLVVAEKAGFAPLTYHHVKFDGTVVGSHTPDGSITGRPVLMQDGRWAAVRTSPTLGVVAYDPTNGVTEHMFNFDPASVDVVGQLAVGMDGRFVITQRPDFIDWMLVAEYDHVGNLLDLAGYTADQTGDGNLIWALPDGQGGLYTYIQDVPDFYITHRDAAGVAIEEKKAWYSLGDWTLAPNGTIWWRESDGWINSLPSEGGGYWQGLGSHGWKMAANHGGAIVMARAGLSEALPYSKTGGQGAPIPLPVSSSQSITSPHFEVLGHGYCTAASNSLGKVGKASMFGDSRSDENTVTLYARDLPVGEPALFLSARDTDHVVGPGGSAGNLCLGGPIGRHLSTVSSVGVVGTVLAPVDLTQIPLGTGGTYAVQPGETWYFQCWYRDGATSNFTDGRAVTFD